jgi:phosphatidylglycerophosphate synthase
MSATTALTDGERWTREQLAALRDRRFAPRAFAAFLCASQARANDVRAARPELARQAWSWSTLGALAIVAGERRRARGRLAWWAACALMLDWHLGTVETLDGRPRPLGAGDALTLARAWLVPCAWERPTALACGLAGLTDALDGPLARRREPTRGGRDFDSIVDACFAAAALRGAVRHALLDRRAASAEAAWLAIGLLHSLHGYFLAVRSPGRPIAGPARVLAPLRMTGIVCAAAGRRRAGSALLAGGALASIALAAEGARR